MRSDFHYHKTDSNSDYWNDSKVNYLTPEEIKSYPPYELKMDGLSPMERAQIRMKNLGLWEPSQIMGRRWAIGCVALEITQRCNLDCTLCYLSESSEAVRDIPMEEVKRRVDIIFAHYGPNTDIQVTGGDPTLRERSELLEIVRYIRQKEMRPTLMTNGIKATRDLLRELKFAGLEDVAFHVDTTQVRKGYNTEKDLHKLRLDYIERARGLGLSVLFNTTVHKDNFADIPEIVRFFRQNADVVNFCSFQLQADTGRGVLRERDIVINPDTVAHQVQIGAEAPVRFDVPMPGHTKCNRYSTTFVTNGRVYDTFYDVPYITKMIGVTAQVASVRGNQLKAGINIVKTVMSDRRNWYPSLRYAGKLLWKMKFDLIKSRFRIRKLSFFIHNFMGACQLEKERIDACAFMVATHEGPISMCMHNAKRDDYILKPIKVKEVNGQAKYWQPLTGGVTETVDTPAMAALRKIPLKGRTKLEAEANEK